MLRGSTGHYKITSVGGEQVQAFIPHPLLPEPNIFLYAVVIAANLMELGYGW